MTATIRRLLTIHHLARVINMALKVRYRWQELLDGDGIGENALYDPQPQSEGMFAKDLNPSAGGFDSEADAVHALEEWLRGRRDFGKYILVKVYSGS